MSAFVHERPLRAFREVTRACDLACRHCRAAAVSVADPCERSTSEGLRLLAQLAADGPPFPHVVLTGGDPLKRADLFELIAAGRDLLPRERRPRSGVAAGNTRARRDHPVVGGAAARRARPPCRYDDGGAAVPPHRSAATARRTHAAGGGQAHAAGIRDGNGILFISHVGDVGPSGFMEVRAGNVREGNVHEIYRTSTLFRTLRDVDAFDGRCGVCEYRAVCGGSRARAYAATGNPRSEDPLCVYTPRALRRPV